jgi:hypothetical protein
MEFQPSSQSLQIVEVLPGWRLGPQPLRLGLPYWRAELNLHELGSARHLMLILHAGR